MEWSEEPMPLSMVLPLESSRGISTRQMQKQWFHAVLVFLNCAKRSRAEPLFVSLYKRMYPQASMCPCGPLVYLCTPLPCTPFTCPSLYTYIIASPPGSVCEWPPTSWDCLCEHVQQDWRGCTIRGLQTVWIRQRLGYVPSCAVYSWKSLVQTSVLHLTEPPN